MPQIYRDEYGVKFLPDTNNYLIITPTKRRFFEADGSDVRLDRVRYYDALGHFLLSQLRDKMNRVFVDNLPDSEDDLDYLLSLPFLHELDE